MHIALYCTHWLFNMLRRPLEISDDKKRYVPWLYVCVVVRVTDFVWCSVYSVQGHQDLKKDERLPVMYSYAPNTKKLQVSDSRRGS